MDADEDIPASEGEQLDAAGADTGAADVGDGENKDERRKDEHDEGLPTLGSLTESVADPNLEVASEKDGLVHADNKTEQAEAENHGHDEKVASEDSAGENLGMEEWSKSTVSDSGSEGKKSGKTKQRTGDPSAHKVTFTVTIAKAMPTVEEDASEPTDATKKKRRIVEAPRAQNYYHYEYQLLPDDSEPVKTDLVTFGVAAKIYTEKQEPKVLKTWRDGDLTWVAWTHIHTVYLTEEMLLKLHKHSLDLRIWDTKDKVSTRARFDRPKAFRLPQAKPGEDPENVGGVKALVLKQSRSFEKMQPKRSYISRSLPSQNNYLRFEETNSKPSSAPETASSGGRSRKGKPVQGAEADMPEKLASYMQRAGHPPTKPGQTSAGLTVPEPTAAPQGKVLAKSYNKLVQLARVQPEPEISPRSRTSPEGRRAKTVPAIGPSQLPGKLVPAASSRPADMPSTPGTLDSDSMLGSSSPSKQGGQSNTSKQRRSRRSDTVAASAAEHARKHGIISLPIRMAQLFAGLQTITERLAQPVPGVEDLFLTISLSGPLMSEELRRKLNPLVIKVHSATQMPNTPMCFQDLHLKCQPAYVKYKFYKEPEYTSISREQDSAIYWDDINVVLAGTLDPLELKEYLTGPPLEIEVHDRDRIMQKQKLKATLFGDDLEDEKISNVGTVSGKRTNHNAFEGRDAVWDPYGVARCDLADLLLGQQVLDIKAPIHPCSMPDVLGLQNASLDTKLVGISGAVDGPIDSPMPAGHYLEANAILKIKIELAHPLVTPGDIAAKNDVAMAEECPFGRMVFRFDYKNVEFLQHLQALVISINAKALQLDHLPQHIIEAALSTYKLSLEQQASKSLDIVTGFQLMDGTMHMFVLEGLRDQSIFLLWQSLPKPENTDVEVQYNSDLCFRERLYGPLDVDLCRVKLHEPLSVIVKQPLLYVRDMVPKPCFEALTKLEEFTRVKRLRDAVRNDLFPSAEMVVSMSREFGVPLTTEDFEELQGTQVVFESPRTTQQEVPHTSRAWTPIDNNNEKYLTQLEEREKSGPPTHFLNHNKELVREKSELNRVERSRTMPPSLRARVKVAHNYSTQSLNSTELAKEALRQHLAQEPDTRFTYCQDYQHSMTVVPVNVEAEESQVKCNSQHRWKTPAGWTYPGRRTMQESNIHPRKPDQARIEELQEPWHENTLHGNKLKETLERDRFTWSRRKQDMDVWTKPPTLFCSEPITIHLAGQKLKEEKTASQRASYQQWQSKILVDDPHMKFHRCATETELTHAGVKSSNQLARLESLLKDKPEKHSLRKPGFALKEIPPLSVVLNPSVDTSARAEGVSLPPASIVGQWVSKKGFIPGPYKEFSWAMDKNRIPVHDYEHSKFIQAKGQDFNVYHKERSVLHKRNIHPLEESERENHLFCLPPDVVKSLEQGVIPRPYVIPSIGEWKRRTMESYDSGIGTFVKSEPESQVIETS